MARGTSPPPRGRFQFNVSVTRSWFSVINDGCSIKVHLKSSRQKRGARNTAAAARFLMLPSSSPESGSDFEEGTAGSLAPLSFSADAPAAALRSRESSSDASRLDRTICAFTPRKLNYDIISYYKLTQYDIMSEFNIRSEFNIDMH